MASIIAAPDANKNHETARAEEMKSLSLSRRGTAPAVAVLVVAVVLGLATDTVRAFATPRHRPSVVRDSRVVVHGYVPSGFTPEEYKKFKEEEAKKAAAKKNLGGLGPRGFKSRSMQSFQEALERGEAEHLLPVFNAKERIRKGELKEEDIPYMQRGGAWDNSDVKGAKRKRWLESDKEYATGGYRKEQSVSIFGYGEGLDWTGKRARAGPSESVLGAAPIFGRNYKAPNVKDIKKSNGNKKSGKDGKNEKKFFGLF